MRRPAIQATLAFGVLLMALTACGERGEPLGQLPPDLPATVQGAGAAPFVAESVPVRIVALDDGIAATAYELGANVVGTRTDAVDPSLETIDDVSGAVDLAAIRALQPDMILATTRTDPALLTALATDPGVPIYVGPDSTADDLIRVAYELAIVLGDPILAREASASFRAELVAASTRAAGVDPVRVFVDTGFRIPPDPNSLFFDLLDRAGGIFVPETATRDNSVEASELADAAPEVYLATVESRVSLASLASDDALANLPAVLSERVVIIDRGILDVTGPDIIATIEELAEILHPAAP